MDHHYSLTGKITSPGTGSEAICMMDQERKRQCHGVKNGGGEGARQESIGKPAETKVICVALDHYDTDVKQQRKKRGGGGGN